LTTLTFTFMGEEQSIEVTDEERQDLEAITQSVGLATTSEYILWALQEAFKIAKESSPPTSAIHLITEFAGPPIKTVPSSDMGRNLNTKVLDKLQTAILTAIAPYSTTQGSPVSEKGYNFTVKTIDSETGELREREFFVEQKLYDEIHAVAKRTNTSVKEVTMRYISKIYGVKLFPTEKH